MPRRPAALSAPQHGISGYQGSDRIADDILTGLYRTDMYRPDVRDTGRVSTVLGAMLLAELCAYGHLGIDAAGYVHPTAASCPADTATGEVLQVIRTPPAPWPVADWVTYLGVDDRARTLVWRRLVERGEAEELRHRWLWWHPRPEFALTTLRSVSRARHTLMESARQAEIPVSTVALWHGLTRLRLDGRFLELDADVCARLDAAAVPPGLQRLLQALDDQLIHQSTCR
jgi:hypothetical protein